MRVEIQDPPCIKCCNESLFVSLPETVTRETMTGLTNIMNYTLQGGVVGDVIRLSNGSPSKVGLLFEEIGEGVHIECENCDFMVSYARYKKIFG